MNRTSLLITDLCTRVLTKQTHILLLLVSIIMTSCSAEEKDQASANLSKESYIRSFEGFSLKETQRILDGEWLAMKETAEINFVYEKTLLLELSNTTIEWQKEQNHPGFFFPNSNQSSLIYIPLQLKDQVLRVQIRKMNTPGDIPDTSGKDQVEYRYIHPEGNEFF